MVELLSIHFPKTGGTSIREILNQHFGDQLFPVYNYTFHTDRGIPESFQVPSNTRALHGHFPARMFMDRYPNARTAVWIREPIERAISYYYFWLQASPHGNPNHDRFLAERPSLLEFSKLLAIEALWYFEKVSTRDFDFIGIMDYFKEDAIRFKTWLENGYSYPKNLRGLLKKMIGLFSSAKSDKQDEIPILNRTNSKAPVSDIIRNEMRKILRYEIEFYEEALSVRTKQ